MSRISKTSKQSNKKSQKYLPNNTQQKASQTINEGQDEDNNKVRIHTCFYVTKCFLNILDKLKCI